MSDPQGPYAAAVPRRCAKTRHLSHDAVMLARVAPIAMLFVRCAGGVSHKPGRVGDGRGRRGGDRLGFENHSPPPPVPGVILLYPGGFSETEILLPLGGRE